MNILNDVLDFSKIEADKLTLHPEPFDLERCIHEVLILLQAGARKRAIDLMMDYDLFLPTRFMADPGRMRQVMTNLIGNAVKFTEHGHVLIRVVGIEAAAGHQQLNVTIEDTGIGIGAENIDRIFGEFAQVDDQANRKFEGTGLGLAITRKIAEAMGGTAGATSIPGKGSTFWFTAVLRKSRDSVEAPTRAEFVSAEHALARNHAGRHILLAEDEPINREIALILLEQVGLRIDLAEDGREAVEKARSGNYAVILMDMQMPVLDGLDATRQIRQLPGHATTPILAMTANAYSENEDQCLDAGMDDFIAKPFTPEVLYEALLRWLERGGRPEDESNVRPAP